MRRKKKLPQGEFEASIESLTLDGRGVAHIDGKATFIHRALPGEQVRFVYTGRRKQFDEGDTVEVLNPSEDRVAPGCPHFEICGGCSMQHLSAEAQVRTKAQVLRDNLERIGKVEPEQWLSPLLGPVWGYRRKARLGVRYVPKKGRVLVGFRERRSPFIAELERCPVLDPRVGEKLMPISLMLTGLEARARIAQIEVACSDERVALVFRNLDPLSDADTQALRDFGVEHGFDIYLQPGGPDTVYPITDVAPLHYRLDEFDVDIGFAPLDFTQVNAEINRQMVPRAVELLEIEPNDRVLDLFAGLGNFTLPLARRAAEVVAVEVDEPMVRRGAETAEANGINNTRHVVGNLFEPDHDLPWMRERYDRILLDPPRAGAEAMMAEVARFAPKRVVYVSCHPGTLARDAGLLVNEHGYKLVAAGVMDMFPHTAHVESIAVFEPG